jgi:hypothetical protein
VVGLAEGLVDAPADILDLADIPGRVARHNTAVAVVAD